MSTPAVSGGAAGTRQWLGLGVLALPTLLLSLDVTVLFLALPHLSADLAAGSTHTLWIMDIYGFMIAGFLITMGTLGDRIGRRRLLLIGGAAFGAASVLAAYASSPEMLIAARALLGIAGATLMPSTLALITTMFTDPRERGMAIGVWVSCFSLGIALGPVIGGLMLEVFWWGSVFLLAVPVMGLLLVLGPIALPEARDENAGRLDLFSVALSLAALIPLIYGVKSLAKSGFGAEALISLLAGICFSAVFVVRQLRLDDPLLDLSLFRNRRFSATLGVVLLGLVTIGGIYLFVTQYLQLVEGLTPLRAGLWLLPAALGMVVSSMVAPALAQRFRPGMVVGGGLAVSTAGYLVLTQVQSVAGLTVLAAGFALVYIGIGPMMALGSDLIVGSAPPEKAGSASAAGETGMEMGIALGIAALGSAGAAVYQGRVSDAMPVDVPVVAADAARDSLAGGYAAVADLPPDVSASLLEPAREAFTTALNSVAFISALLVLGLALLAMVTLRHIQPVGSQPTEEGPEPGAAAGATTAGAEADVSSGAGAPALTAEPPG